MNPLPPNADELVSAYLDGQAAPDEVVRVESSPELMERVDAMRSIADLVGEPAAPPAAQKEAHISAALDAFDALFNADAAETEPLAALAPLAAVPTLGEPEAPTPEPVSPATEPTTPDGVTSLAAARERRRPRRFNAGIIAAAAAVLLFVAVAAFGLGGGESSLDIASTTAEGIGAADDSAEVEAASDAMDDEESMEADRPALSELQAAPAPTAAAPQAAEALPAEDAAMNEAPMDEEESMADEAADDADTDSDDGGAVDADSGASAEAESFAIEPFRLFEGDFPDQNALRLQLKQLPVDDLTERVDALEPGLFPSCQQDVPELADIETPTIIGDAFIAGEAVEIHQIVDGDTVTIVLVDPTDCSVLPETP